LVREIRRTMERRGLTQVQVSKLTSVDQPTLSKLLRGRMSNFSFDRLTLMLRDLGRNMALIIEEEPAGVGDGLRDAKTTSKMHLITRGHMLVASTSQLKFNELSGEAGEVERA